RRLDIRLTPFAPGGAFPMAKGCFIVASAKTKHALLLRPRRKAPRKPLWKRLVARQRAFNPAHRQLGTTISPSAQSAQRRVRSQWGVSMFRWTSIKNASTKTAALKRHQARWL